MNVFLIIVRAVFSFLLVFTLLLGGADVQAGVLSDRLSTFPDWESKPAIAAAKGDLVYPDWMAGTWQVTSTLVDMVAPLSPDIVTPGFESNRRYLNQPISFKVRFQPVNSQASAMSFLPNRRPIVSRKIVADRAFNGLNIGKAYLGETGVIAVKVDPKNPNRQVTFLKGDQQLISTVTSRGTERRDANEFIAAEVCQQIFQGESQIYLNEVETTTVYHFLGELKKGDNEDREIAANQLTAIYLSPQDPDYFAAGGRPVALYRYHLHLTPIE